VVSTPLPSLAGVERVARADEAEETVVRVEAELAADGEAARFERSRAAAGHSWDARLAEIAAAIQAAERRP
jgi:hypothetical protein